MDFCGHSYAQLDDKNRVRIPGQYKDLLGEEPYLVIGPNHSLYIYTEAEYEIFRSEIGNATTEKDAAAIRLLNMYTYRIHYDNQGRYLVPQVLLEYAEIDKDVVFVGNRSKVEMWSKEHFDAYLAEIKPDINALYSFVGRL